MLREHLQLSRWVFPGALRGRWLLQERSISHPSLSCPVLVQNSAVCQSLQFLHFSFSVKAGRMLGILHPLLEQQDFLGWQGDKQVSPVTLA